MGLDNPHKAHSSKCREFILMLESIHAIMNNYIGIQHLEKKMGGIIFEPLNKSTSRLRFGMFPLSNYIVPCG